MECCQDIENQLPFDHNAMLADGSDNSDDELSNSADILRAQTTPPRLQEFFLCLRYPGLAP